MQNFPTANRKRPAPGAEPLPSEPVASQQQQQQQQYAFPMSDAEFNNTFGFNQQYAPTNQAFPDQNTYDTNSLATALNPQQGGSYGNLGVGPISQSTDLVPRPRNNALMTPNNMQDQWNGNNTPFLGQAEDENEEELDRKVAMAKKDAQGKRKQIPPFVQKLASFLDDHNQNQELIRWSDDGRSFIVVDEDEFARTLIPELFKHNNYASFVRQLNMYGFHKTVNITDGSLRQSEKARKGMKPPSMYSHPYFRRNRPDLLWLIQKPSTKNTKRKREDGSKGQGDSDDERQYSPIPEGKPGQGELGAPGGHDLTTLPRNELTAVRQEIHKLQSQQKMISSMISQLREQNDQFYRQATAFQQLHDRHENSINAILTFLASFYNRSLENHTGQNFVNMFANAAAQHNSQQQGSVVEDFTDAPPHTNSQMQRYHKRPPLLLTAPPSSSSATQQQQPPGSATTAPASARSSVTPPTDKSFNKRSQSAQPDHARQGSVNTVATDSPQVKDDQPTPNMLNHVPENNDMMSIINSVNATNASTPTNNIPNFDLSTLENYQNNGGGGQMTPQMRNDLVNFLSNAPGGNQNARNAMVGKSPAMPDMEAFNKSRQQLDLLENLQREQDAKLQRLNSQLQPLSPTGTIPGLAQTNDESSNYFDPTGAPGDFDPSSFIDFDASNPGNLDDINFDFDEVNNNNNDGIDFNFDENSNVGMGDNMFGANTGDTSTGGGRDTDHLAPPNQNDEIGGGGRVESVSSEATSPAVTVKGESEEPATPDHKRQKQS